MHTRMYLNGRLGKFPRHSIFPLFIAYVVHDHKCNVQVHILYFVCVLW